MEIYIRKIFDKITQTRNEKCYVQPILKAAFLPDEQVSNLNVGTSCTPE